MRAKGRGEDAASSAGSGNEIPSVSAAFVIQKQCRKIQPCHQRMQNPVEEEENEAWPVPFLSLSITSSCVMCHVSRSDPQ